MQPRIIGYVRVSTDDQAESGLGLQAQRDRLHAACDFKGWTLVDVIADEGLSGTTVAGRPGLKRALKQIARGEADGLLAAKLDRLSRSSKDTAEIFEWFRDTGATLCLLDVDMDTTSPMGQAVLGFMAVMAQLERDMTADRTRQALAVKRGRGQRVGRPGVHEIPTLHRRIRKMRDHGEHGIGPMTYQAIADRLNLDQVPTLRGAPKWTVSAVQTACGYKRPAARKAKTSLPPIPKGRRTRAR